MTPQQTRCGMPQRRTVQEYLQKHQIHLAVKVTVGATLCACITNLFHLPSGYLSSLVIALTLILFHGRTVRVGIPAILGLFVAGSGQVVLTMLIGDSAAAYLICSMGWLFLWMAFLPSLPLAHLLGGIVIATILFNFVLGTSSVREITEAFWVQCSLGIVLAMLLDRLIWPQRTQDGYFEVLAGLLESFAADIDVIAGFSVSDSREHSAHATEIRHIAHLAGLSHGADPAEDERRIRLNLECRLIWERIRLANQFIGKNGHGFLSPDQREEFSRIYTGLADHYRSMAAAALHQKPASRVDAATQNAIGALVDKLRKAEGHRDPVENVIDGTAPLVRLMEHGLSGHNHLIAIYNAVLSRLSRKRTWRTAVSEPFSRILTWPRPEGFKAAARLVLIVVVLWFLVTYCGLPGSSLVAFYGISFGLAVNIGQLYMKGRSGVVGVAGGIGMGLVGLLIVTQSPHFPVLIGLFAIAMFIAAYAATAGDPIGFAGLQAALITPYMFLIYEGPVWTVDNAVTRAWALVVSAAVAMVVQRFAWPADPLVLFRNVISETLDKIAEIWERVRKDDPEISNQSVLAFGFDQSLSLLKDSRYEIGSQHPLASSYLKLLRSLQDIFANMRALAQLRTLAEDDRIFQSVITRITPELTTITVTLESLSRSLQVGNTDLGALPHRLDALRSAVEKTGKEYGPETAPETRQHLSVLASLVSEMTRSLAHAVEAAQNIPATTPVAMIGSSEGWQSSARATPAH